MKTIIDTDIGGDADDAFALLLAVNSPEIDLGLVVTNDEHLGIRARFASEWLRLMGSDVPVVAGRDLGNTKYCLVGGLISEPDACVETNAVEQIAQTVLGERMTHYVCIGPQSNLAEFIRRYPGLKSRVKVHIMGGGVNPQGKAEHNIRYDIPAARTVFHSGWDIRYITADVTFNEALKIDREHPIYKALAASGHPGHEYMIQSVERFFTGSRYQHTLMHDPLTLSTVWAEYVGFKKEDLSMAEDGIIREGPFPTLVSVSAHYDLFMKMLAERISR